MKEFIKKIERINFGLMSPEDIRKMSVVRVETPDTYDSDGYPIENGLMDPRLGVLDPSLRCHTCGVRGGDCQGHFGSIELARPVLHVGFGDIIHKILRSTCNHCGRVLLPEDVLDDYREKLADAVNHKENLEDILKKIQNEAKKVEMNENKQNDLVDKIMGEIYPEKDDEYDDADRQDILLNILNQLYAEAYMERDETEEKHSFKYIDPKQLCPHCRKNQSLEDIEASYDIIETKNTADIESIKENIRANIDDEYAKKIAKIDKKLAEDIDSEEVEKLEEERAKLVEEQELKSDKKFNAKFKRRIRDYIKEYVKDLVQESIVLDKPTTISQGEYKLTASEIRERLKKIPDEDLFLLGINLNVARPEWLVLTVLPVPPVTVRPSVTSNKGERSEDDLTHKLVDILRINQRLVENMEAGAPQLIVEDLWDLLQYHVTTYFDNEASGVPPSKHRSGRPLKTLTQRLKGKEGRFRSNLSGKRVNFSARTVISPDPNISINEVGVPEMIAKEVTVPAYVNDWNIDEIKTYIENGPDVHPGANYMITESGNRRKINEDTKEFILENLKPGDVVERHLKDGDMVLFNRQPSIHRMSMMAHEVKVLPYKTFRLNPCVCPPYNADFDGDEMNLHVLQSYESRAEAKSLMRVQEHILSPKFGGPVIAAIHDHISGAYLLTRKSMKFSQEEALQIICKSHLPIPENDGEKWLLKKNVMIDESVIEKPNGEQWTGKELFSLLLPNDLNLLYRAEICTKCGQCDKILKEATDSSLIDYDKLCPIDALVIIENGILKQGVIDKKAYGSISGQILDKIVKEYGTGRAKEFLDRSTDLAICAIMITGMTISLNDFEIPDEVQTLINNHLETSEQKVDKLIDEYNNHTLDALPGRSLEETLEIKIMQVLWEARDKSGEIAKDYFDMNHNHSVLMAHTGSRGSMSNLTQITSCLGQQAVRGGRIHKGYIERTLPHFKRNELGAKAKGFIHSSYKSGLDPIEFFFHAMGGREGLVDTAIRTAQSGFMQRRLVNALHDLQVKSSGIVTDNQENVVQRIFGDDGVDPAKSDFGIAANLDKLIDEIKLEGNSNIFDNYNSKDNIIKPKIKKPEIKISKFSSEDLDKLDEFIEILENEINNLENSEINSFIDSYPDFTNELNDFLSKHENLLKEIISKKKELLFKKSKLIDNSLLIFNINTYDYVNDYPNKVKKLLSGIDNKIIEIKNSDKFLDKIYRPQLILKRNKLIFDIEKYINNINEFIDENGRNDIFNSLDDVNKIINALNGLIKNLNINYDSYKEFNSAIRISESSFSNLKTEFLVIKDDLNKKIAKNLLIEYQILFDEEIITKEEFNELKKEINA